MFVKSNCPECGARLNVDTALESLKCEYCGTVSRIADKKKPQVQPKAAPGGNVQPVIWVSSAASYTWVWILSAFLPIAISGFVFYNVSSSMSTAFGTSSTTTGTGTGTTSSPSSFSSQKMQWTGHRHPMLVDINGDGVMDVIGWVQIISMVGGDSYESIAAFDPLTGNRLWDTGALVNSRQSADVRAALAGDKLLVADSMGVLKAFSLANGATAWQAVLGERAERICGAEAGYAAIYTKDKRILKAAAATGQLLPSGQWEYNTPCPPLQNDRDSTGPFFLFEELSRSARFGDGPEEIEYDDLPGMRADSVLTDLSNNRVFAFGSRSPGTRTPVIAALTQGVASKKKKWQSTWLSSVTTLNPLTIYEGNPEHGGAASGRLVTIYKMQDYKSGHRLSCLDENTGQIVWDVPVPKSDTGTVGPINVSQHYVFVPHWTYLDIFQLVDGVHKMTIGNW